MPRRTPTSEVYAGMSLPENRQYLVINNMRLVHYIIKKYVKPAPGDYDDFVQVGMMGLIKAAIGWDETKGNKFSTYATRMILGYCQTYKRQQHPLVKYDRKTIDNYTHIAQLTAEGKDEKAIMAELGLTVIEYAEAINVYSPDSLDRELNIHNGDGDSVLLSDTVSDPEGSVETSYETVEAEAVFLDVLAQVLKGVDQRQADIYEEYIYSLMSGETLKQVYFAEKYGLSQSYVSRILSKMHRKFRAQLRHRGIGA